MLFRSVGVGFGIRDAATAKTIGKVADAVVIGSKLLQIIETAGSDQASAQAERFMRDIRQALDSV